MLSAPQPLPCGTRAPCRRCFFCLITQCASRSRRFLAVHLQESKSPRTQTPGAARDTKIQKWASLPVHDILARLDRPLTSRLNHVTKISCIWRRQGFRTCKCHVAGHTTLRCPTLAGPPRSSFRRRPESIANSEWIPAFAGMTSMGKTHRTRDPCVSGSRSSINQLANPHTCASPSISGITASNAASFVSPTTRP
jgi:hypothetical protein